MRRDWHFPRTPLPVPGSVGGGSVATAALGLLILWFAPWLNQGALWEAWDSRAEDKLSPVLISYLQTLDPAPTEGGWIHYPEAIGTRRSFFLPYFH